MKKLVLAFVAAALLAASSITGGASIAAEKGVPEVKTIKWAQGLSGNILVTLAKELGYFDEVGVNVEEIPLDPGGLQGVRTGQVDIASNFGTDGPLRMIGVGDPITIFGGFMLTGCMPTITRSDVEWEGVKSLVGKRVASTLASYAMCNRLIEEGFDPVKDVEWVHIDNDSDKIASVLKGEVDFATLGTGRMFAALNTDGIKIVTYQSDLTPNYSCCRMVTRDDFAKENPVALKLMTKALIRAQSYFYANREKCVSILAKQLDTTEEYVSAYMLNEHYRINVDPIRNPVKKYWAYLNKVGILEGKDDSINLDDHINTAIYEAALNEAAEEYGSEAPQFYADAIAFYKAHNL